MRLPLELRPRLVALLMAPASVLASALMAPATTWAQIQLAGDSTTDAGVQHLPAEGSILQQSRHAIPLGRELSALEQISPADRTPEQSQRLAELQQAQAALYEAFYQFVESPEVRAQIDQLRAASRGRTIAPETLTDLRHALDQISTPAVLYYPLILEDRLELVVVTADAPPLRRTVEVSRAKLYQAVAEFRQALQDPRSDVLPIAQKLYQWLIQPIEEDLAQASAEAILAAPDGVLRYIPLAALHDGEQWLVERFAVNHLTAASLTDFSREQPSAPWRILAAALTEGPYEVRLGERTMTLSPIPGAIAEVDAIAALFPNTTILRGTDFTPEAIQSQANSYNILHLATHSAIIPGSPQDSFILFGNGDVLTLPNFRLWRLNNTELVVLSGSETAVGGVLSDGAEVLGLGYMFERAGARAVMASLWDVSDGGTKELMASFYGYLSQNLSFAASLRQAQIAQIATGDRSPRSHQKGSITIDSVQRQPANFGHPYYWAPFILIGNGL